MQNDNKRVLIGCGILKDEVIHLAELNNWPLEFFFLDSSLHVDFQHLRSALEAGFKRYKNRPITLCYGTCHPCMEELINPVQALRTDAQNCVEMLLGPDRFTSELSAGAFFLMEDWVLRWDYVVGKALGGSLEEIKQIFQSEHKYFLALNTPCSGSFKEEAMEISRRIGLPLKWMDVSLEHLEQLLKVALSLTEPDGTGAMDNQPGELNNA